MFLVPSPLGANLTRFGMYAAGPVLLALVPRRVAIAALAPLLLFWQWSPAFDAILRAGDDPSIEQAYYVPLLQHLGSVDAENRRTEIVPTARHWETAFVAAQLPDRPRLGAPARHPLQRAVLRRRPDGRRRTTRGCSTRVSTASPSPTRRSTTPASRRRRCIEQGLPFLRPVWSDRHWRVWEVVDATGVVDGPATVVDITADTVTLDVLAPGDVTLRVRDSAFWRTEPAVCVEPTDDGWLVLRDVPAGRLEVFLSESDLLTDGADPCEAP